jgi:hypothetical protein
MPETPANGQYMVAAYIIAAVIYVTYSAALWWRGKKALESKK